MKLTLRIRLLIGKLLERKKKPVSKFSGPLYQLKKPKDLAKQPHFFMVAYQTLEPFLKECGNVVYGDLKWLFTHRKTTAQQKWDEAVIQMRKEQ
jgi:hypothetical protein